MQHYASIQVISLENSWLTIGVFDGVHRGHQQIIQRLTAGAHANEAPAVVLTFDPHPARIFGRGEIKLLTLPEERAELLASMGVDIVITHPFDRTFADTTAVDFMRLVKQHFGVSHLVLGYDSTVGKNREGNAARLREIGRDLGYTVEMVPALSDESGVISSTEIRKLVAAFVLQEATGRRQSAREAGRKQKGGGRRMQAEVIELLRGAGGAAPVEEEGRGRIVPSARGRRGSFRWGQQI